MRHYPSIEILEDRIAPATIINLTTVTYQDSDGDHVVIKFSKPFFTSNAVANQLLTFSSSGSIFGGVVGNNSIPESLTSINLAGFISAQGISAQGMDISVTVQARAGGTGDGRADVQSIYAGSIDPDFFRFQNNIDLGNVTIQGNLGQIIVGDDFNTPALKSLTVDTLGLNGNTLYVSSVLGPITNLHVTGDLVGQLHMYGFQSGSIGTLTIDGALKGTDSLNAVGSIFFSGTIGNATIGKIIGANATNSGAIIGVGTTANPAVIKSLHVLNTPIDLDGTHGAVTGTGFTATKDSETSTSNSGAIIADNIGSIQIDGDLTGGAGPTSGFIKAQKIGSVSIAGNLTGGAGDNSGNIQGTQSLGVVNISGSLHGGAGKQSGFIFSGTPTVTTGTGHSNQPGITLGGDVQGGAGNQSGVIYGDSFKNIVVKGSLIGAGGASSGWINSDGDIAKLSIGGSITGGTGKVSGAVFAGGSLGSLTVAKDVHGADSATGISITQSAFISAKHIGSITIGGSLIAGKKNTGAILDSGAIRSGTDIGSINIAGDMKGDSTNPAIISAIGFANLGLTAATDLAINKIVIGGNMTRAAILAGYGDATTSSSIYGTEANSHAQISSLDAQINSVVIGGNLTASNIVAGVSAGADKFFGTKDDASIAGFSNILSKISSILVKGSVGSSASTNTPQVTQNEAFGIVAEEVVSVDVHGVAIPLVAGASNDLSPGVDLGSTTLTTATADPNHKEFHVLEV